MPSAPPPQLMVRLGLACRLTRVAVDGESTLLGLDDESIFNYPWLYAVEVGHYVPERFYQAIAEILAYIYELTGRTTKVSRTRGMEAQLS